MEMGTYSREYGNSMSICLMSRSSKGVLCVKSGLVYSHVDRKNYVRKVTLSPNSLHVCMCSGVSNLYFPQAIRR